jgi:hypothetical protein
MARNALTATEVAVKGESGHVILDRGEIKTLLKEGRIAGVYKYALHERSLPESIGEPDREFPVGAQGGVLLDTRPKAESVISSSEPDRDGDIMRQPGLVITDNYRRNPTVFGLHEHTIPVGFTELLRQYPLFTWARWQWLDDVPQSEGKDYYEMWAKHVLNCTSVGFLINDWAPIKGEDFWAGWDIKEWELLEHSPVSLPSNREAMRTDGLKSLFRSYVERVYEGPSPVLRRMFEETEMQGRSVQVAPGGMEEKGSIPDRAEQAKRRVDSTDKGNAVSGTDLPGMPALKVSTVAEIRLAAAAGAITVDRAFELVGEIVEDSQLVIAQRDAALGKAEQKVLDLEKEVTTLSAQIVEACG